MRGNLSQFVSLMSPVQTGVPPVRVVSRALFSLARTALLSVCAAGCLSVKEPPLCQDVVTRTGQLEHLRPLFAHLPAKAADNRSISPWEIEAILGNRLARELNWSQALWCFQRAALLAPEDLKTQQFLAFDQLLCRYFANQPQETARLFQTSSLADADSSWTCYTDLLAILADSYGQLAKALHPDWREKREMACRALQRADPEKARRVLLRGLVQDMDIEGLKALGSSDSSAFYLPPLMQVYQRGSRDPRRAGLLNALLPGAGYWYVGQRQTAATAFVLNALFGAAAWRFFQKGYPAAGLLTLSFEFGWYFGGIQGASLAAREFNRARFAPLGNKILREQGLERAPLICHGF